jgi:hypothetical protein
MKHCATLLVVLLAGWQAASAQGLSGHFVTSVYGWERQDSLSSAGAGASSQHVSLYENANLDAVYGTVSLHTAMQVAKDFSSTAIENDALLRLFNAYVQVRDIGGIADLKLGRQSVLAGVGYGSIDGALVRMRPSTGVELMGYAGGLAPASQKPDFFQNLSDNWQAGGQVLLSLVPDTKVGISYMNRHRESSPFYGYRPDAQMRPVLTLVDYGSRANQYGSVSAQYWKDVLWVMGRCDYDFNYSRLARAELAAQYAPMTDLYLTLNAAHREPTIAYNSYFALFEAEANQEIMLGADYVVHPLLALSARVSTVLYDGDNAMQIAVGASNKYASLLYTRDMSYDGDLDGFNAQVSYPFWRGLVTPHLGVTYSSYALSADLDRLATWAGVAGATVRPWKVLSVDLQGQYLSNRIYQRDIRAFARVNYWFAALFGGWQ